MLRRRFEKRCKEYRRSANLCQSGIQRSTTLMIFRTIRLNIVHTFTAFSGKSTQMWKWDHFLTHPPRANYPSQTLKLGLISRQKLQTSCQTSKEISGSQMLKSPLLQFLTKDRVSSLLGVKKLPSKEWPSIFTQSGLYRSMPRQEICSLAEITPPNCHLG